MSSGFLLRQLLSSWARAEHLATECVYSLEFRLRNFKKIPIKSLDFRPRNEWLPIGLKVFAVLTVT